MKLIYESKPGELKHGLFWSKGRKKYIEKIKMPNGKFRYFYTQEELDAYNAEQKKIRDANRQKTRSNTPANQANRDARASQLSGKPKKNVSKEYLEELEYNSRKNETKATKEEYERADKFIDEMISNLPPAQRKELQEARKEQKKQKEEQAKKAKQDAQRAFESNQKELVRQWQKNKNKKFGSI